MRLALMFVVCVLVSCRCSQNSPEQPFSAPMLASDGGESNDRARSPDGHRVDVVRESDVVLPVDGGLGAFVSLSDGSWIVEDWTIPRSIRRFAADMTSAWKLDLLEIDYPSAMRVVDLHVVDDSVWIALECNEEVQIAGRRHKPRKAQRDVLVLRVSVATGEIKALSKRTNRNVNDARFASYGSVVYLASLVDGSRVEIERLGSNADATWTVNLSSPAFERTLEFSAAHDGVDVTTSARDHATVGDKRLDLPAAGFTAHRYLHVSIDHTGIVRELELVPVTDVTSVAAATNGSTRLFLFGGDCRFIVRDSTGWSMEHLFRGIRCGAPRVIAVPNGFLLATHVMLDNSRGTWRLLVVTTSGRILSTVDVNVPTGLDPFYLMKWQRDHVESWRPEQESQDTVEFLGNTLRSRTPIARWSITSALFKASR